MLAAGVADAMIKARLGIIGQGGQRKPGWHIFTQKDWGVNRVTYKGYEIHAVPLPVASGAWDTTLYIRIGRKGGWRDKKFTGAATFKTEEEAIQYCLETGKKIIDGAIEHCSVADL